MKIARSVGGYKAILYDHKTKHQNMITNIVTVDYLIQVKATLNKHIPKFM
jgi:hypothetical protein